MPTPFWMAQKLLLGGCSKLTSVAVSLVADHGKETLGIYIYIYIYRYEMVCAHSF